MVAYLDGTTEEFTYDYYDTDLIESVTQGAQTTGYEYNARGEPTKVTRAGETETHYDYFPNGLLKEIRKSPAPSPIP